jgi:hypothetical protein
MPNKNETISGHAPWLIDDGLRISQENDCEIRSGPHRLDVAVSQSRVFTLSMPSRCGDTEATGGLTMKWKKGPRSTVGGGLLFRLWT